MKKIILALMVGCLALVSCQQQRPHFKHHRHHHHHGPCAVAKGIVK